ncbi:VWA domain-containing protein [Granulicella cerasi]|uniref:VWA domain-containing protein n=1 Tax=Granulicella cerasi TaxID=741063 RepID=A0ABW1ZD24_9BACT|nr:VWA domain-containing protein [Granulicella cerasi]
MKSLWLLPLALACALHAQQAPAPVERHMPDLPTIKVTSRLVPVAVNVVDEHGAPVAGLTQEDFEVLEDGKPQKIAVFEKESTTPLSMVITVDASESTIAQNKLERDAMRDFLRKLMRPQDRAALFAFADTVDEVVPFTNDAHKLESGFGKIQRGDATAMYDAIYLGAQHLGTSQDPAARRVLVVISDGVNTTHHGSYDAAFEQAQRAGAMIYSLIVVPVEADAGRNTGGEHALMQLSKDTGGKFYEIIAKQDVVAAFEHLSDDLRTQYTVGYYAPQQKLGRDNLHRIELRLKDQSLRAKYTLRYRTSYYAR